MDLRASLSNVEMQAIPVPQWKDLCKELRLHHSGRKDELRTRVVSFLVTEEGRRRVAGMDSSAALRRVVYLVEKMQNDANCPTSAPALLAPSVMKPCVCGGSASATGLACLRCGAFQHTSCMGKAAAMDKFECPLCQIHQMEPYEPIVEVVLPPCLPCTSGSPLCPLQFYYSEDQQRKLSASGRARQLQFRCIRLDEEGYTHHWPKECSIILNGKTLANFAQPPSTSARKRKDAAIIVTQLGIGNNEVMLVRQREESLYAFGLFIVERLPAIAVIANMSVAAEMSYKDGLALVRTRICGSDEVTTGSYRQSLKCPLTRLMPDTPSRGSRCKHIQCFDLQPYIIMQEKAKVNRWRCPICSTLVLNVCIDLYMKEIVERAVKLGASAVEFSPDGSYTLVKEEEDESDSEEEDKIGAKRVGTHSDPPAPVKRPAPSPDFSLHWPDFLHSNSHADNVNLDLLHHTVAYQNAYRKSICKSSSDRVKPHRKLGTSMDCPIELDD